MFMFQSIYGLVADFYNIDENLALMLGQISLILLAIVLLPYAFLSDFVSVRTVVITSSMMVAFGSILKTLARDLNAEAAGKGTHIKAKSCFRRKIDLSRAHESIE